MDGGNSSREGETQTYYSTDSYHCWLLCTPADCNAMNNKFIRAVFLGIVFYSYLTNNLATIRLAALLCVNVNSGG